MLARARAVRPVHRPAAVLRIVFGLVWAIDAGLEWRAGFRNSFGPTLAYGAAVTETLLAVAVVVGFARKSIYAFGAVYALVVWAAAEAAGIGINGIGTSVIYSFVFVALLIMSAQAGPDPFSVDSFLEARISWWWRVAEVRPYRPAPAPAPGRGPLVGPARRRPPAVRTLVAIPVDLIDDDWPA
jgi:uncharacterized membrane protein YphA (DoxX/SURF4 family)